jgi:acyl-CoA reductase-like NAD-dependent aldehyde dehydrogenase
MNLVGGEWVEAVAGGVMEVRNPATGDAIGTVPRGDPAR